MNSRVHEAPKIYKKKNKKKLTVKKAVLVLGVLAIIYLSLFLLVVPERPSKAFFDLQGPAIIAYQGGARLAPENTLVAFEKAKSLGVDMIHFNLHMTKDGQLIVIQDLEVDRTTNGEGKVNELTLAEIRQLDAAYRFQDIRGRYIYRNQGIQIPTVEEVFQQFGDMRFIIDIKEVDYSEIDEELEKKLWELIETYHMQENVLIYSDSDEVKQRFNQYAQGQVALGASKQEVTRFIFYHKVFLGRLYRPQSDALILDPQSSIFNLTDKRLINGAERLNMRIYYGAVDDEEKIRDLVDRDANGIMSNRPELLIRIAHEVEVLNGTN